MNNTLKNIIIACGSIALIMFGINAFAHSGMGWGHHGFGWHHQDEYCPGNTDSMSQEKYEQFEQQREAFFQETQGIRDNLSEKERELDNELSRNEPDVSKASRLQKEISELQSQFDQKRIEHMVEMKKLDPHVGRYHMYGNRMMGESSFGGGHCWQ